MRCMRHAHSYLSDKTMELIDHEDVIARFGIQKTVLLNRESEWVRATSKSI